MRQSGDDAPYLIIGIPIRLARRIPKQVKNWKAIPIGPLSSFGEISLIKLLMKTVKQPAPSP